MAKYLLKMQEARTYKEHSSADPKLVVQTAEHSNGSVYQSPDLKKAMFYRTKLCKASNKMDPPISVQVVLSCI